MQIPLLHHPLDRYETNYVATRSAAYELALSCFPGLLHFSFAPADRPYLSRSGVSLDEVYLSTVRSSGHEISLADENCLAVLGPISGIIEIARGKEIRISDPSDVLIVGTGQRETKLSPGYFGSLIKIPAHEIAQRVSRVAQDDITVKLEGPGHPSGATLTHTLQRYIHYLLEELRASDQLLKYTPAMRSSCSLLLDLVAGHWLDGQGYGSLRTTLPGTWQLKRAENFILANATNPISIADVADAVGVSVRSLQLAFRSFRDTTPRAFIANARLDSIREVLQKGEPDTTVTAVALSASVIHLGRFSRRYLLRFGELPSETLQKAQQRR